MADQQPAGNTVDAGNLEKLPLEIRKQIYTHLLVEPKTIAIERYLNPKDYKKGEVARMDHHRKADRRRKVYDRRQKSWVGAPPSTTSIFLVNKAVCQEAAPVFYGSNDFFFQNCCALQDFLTSIGLSRQYLRHVEVEGHTLIFNSTWATLDRSLNLLRSAKGLRALHFYHHGFCYNSRDDHVDILKLGKYFAPLLQSLKVGFEAQSVHLDVLDVVKIVLPPCDCQSRPEPKKRCHVFDCRTCFIHRYGRFRSILTPGVEASRGSFRSCECLCEDADDNNTSLNETLRDEIKRQLALHTDHEDA